MTGTAATIALAYSVSAFVASVFDGRPVDLRVIPLFLASATFKASQSWLQEFLAVRASSSAKKELRERLVKANWSRPERASFELGVLAGRGLDALDPYFAKYLPQLIYTAIVTPIMVAVFLFADFVSGMTLAVTIPLIPMFMMLIGWATAELQTKQFDSLAKLAGHFAEVLKALGTLKLFGRAKKQQETISKVSNELRVRTMKVLRVSFLSGFALELAASLSVALIAVSIGMRLVNSEIGFQLALFLLVLAPEAFLPLRAVGANFHASSEGIAAATKVLEYLEVPEGVSVQRLDAFEFSSGFTLIQGPSGVGKSTIFAELLGFSPERGRFDWLSANVQVRRELVAWMPQHTKLENSSVLENIVGKPLVSESALKQALEFASASELADLSVATLSGGEASRVSLARAIYRLKQKDLKYLLLDEPTASVDLATARKIRERLRLLADGGVIVVVISHESDYVEIADKVVSLA